MSNPLDPYNLNRKQSIEYQIRAVTMVSGATTFAPEYRNTRETKPPRPTNFWTMITPSRVPTYAEALKVIYLHYNRRIHHEECYSVNPEVLNGENVDSVTPCPCGSEVDSVCICKCVPADYRSGSTDSNA